MSKDILCPTCQKYTLVGPKPGKYGDYYSCDGYRQTGGKLRCGFISQEQYEKLERGGTVQPKPVGPKVWFGGPYYPKTLFDRFSDRHIAPASNATDEQQAIFAEIKRLYQYARAGAPDGKALLQVNAYAGSGKTWSLVQSSARLPNDAEITAVVYNKRNQTEMAERFPTNTFTSTINALGHMIIQRWLGRCRAMNKDKTMHMIAAEWGEENLKDEEYFFAAVRADDLVSKCKLTLVREAEATDDLLMELADYYTIPLDGVEVSRCFDMVRHVLKHYWTKDALLKFGIDYDDQVCIPVIHNLPCPKFHMIYVDEAQDINNARRALIKMMADVIVIVGDKHQAIYGFAGANTASMQTFCDEIPQNKTLPLSYNWRCGTDIIQVAQCIVPEIKAGRTHTGDIYSLAEERAPEIMRAGDMGLCRTNAPLISLAYGFIKANVPVCILGRDIGKNLKELVLRLARKGKGRLAREFVSVPELLDRVDAYLQAEAEKIKPGKRAEEKLQQLTDKVDSIKALCEGMRSVGNNDDSDDLFTVLGRINALFTDDSSKGQIVLCTVHKSKGLEAPRVFLFRTELMPFPYARGEWQIEQEYNLLYVAVTRAMESLFFCGPIPAKLAPIAHLVKPYRNVVVED